MKFYMPVKVFDEPECVAAHAVEMASFGSKALIVTGHSSAKRCGALDDVTSALASNGKEYCVFDRIEENPSEETVLEGALYGKSEDADFVIGIGGGSPMDASKAIAFLMKRENPKREDLRDTSIPTVTLPVIAVPTTCGTGSEVTAISVLTIHAKRTKGSIPHMIFPDLALIDGKYLKGAPASVITNTATDALAHMLESYMNVKSDDYSRAIVLEGLKIWSGVKNVVSGKRTPDDGDYAALMRASTFAGAAIAQTGTSIPHALSYVLTYDEKIPHGKACGYFLPGFIAEAEEKDRDTLLHAAGFDGLRDFREHMAAAFPELEVPEATLDRTFREVAANTGRLKGCRIPMNEEVLKRIVYSHKN